MPSPVNPVNKQHIGNKAFEKHMLLGATARLTISNVNNVGLQQGKALLSLLFQFGYVNTSGRMIRSQGKAMIKNTNLGGA